MRENILEDRIVVRVDSLVGMVAAVRYGMGLRMLLCLLADEETKLVRLAEPVDELDTDLWILTHPALKGVARIKAFTAFLYDRLARATSCFTPVLDSVSVAQPSVIEEAGLSNLTVTQRGKSVVYTFAVHLISIIKIRKSQTLSVQGCSPTGRRAKHFSSNWAAAAKRPYRYLSRRPPHRRRFNCCAVLCRAPPQHGPGLAHLGLPCLSDRRYVPLSS